MRTILLIFANVFIIGLFLYSKLLPHKSKLNNRYKVFFNTFDNLFTPILNFLKNYIRPFQVGPSIAVDITQIILLLFLLMIINYI